jgi:ATP-binding cassette subfamily B protein
MLKDAPIILLDEATASLDTENESKIQNALSELIKNKTVLIIAHRMRTVSGADKIVVIKEGSIVETGTPSQLKEQQGIFASMVKTQYQSN